MQQEKRKKRIIVRVDKKTWQKLKEFAKDQRLELPDLLLKCTREAQMKRKLWTRQEDMLLGKMPDTVVAEVTGRTRNAVAQRRFALRVAAFRQGRPPHEPK